MGLRLSFCLTDAVFSPQYLQAMECPHVGADVSTPSSKESVLEWLLGYAAGLVYEDDSMLLFSSKYSWMYADVYVRMGIYIYITGDLLRLDAGVYLCLSSTNRFSCPVISTLKHYPPSS